MNLVRATLSRTTPSTRSSTSTSGPKSVADTAKEMGITTKLDGYPAEGLGGLTRGVSPLEMANAYATLASGGMRNKPIAILRVKFPDGEVEDLGKPKRERVLSDARRLRGDEDPEAERARRAPARARNIGCPSAGKTGTTDNFNDAWFDGYTPHLADGGLGRLSGRAAGDAQRARHLGRGRHLPGRDLEQVHAGRQGRQLRRLPAAEEHDLAGRRSSASTPRAGPSYGYSGGDGYDYGDTTGGGYQGYDPRLYDEPSGEAPSNDEQPGSAPGNDGGRRNRPGTAEAARSAGGARPRAGRAAALALLLLTYVALAVLWAEPGSDVVLATAAGRRTGCSARSSRSAPASPTAACPGRCSTPACGPR